MFHVKSMDMMRDKKIAQPFKIEKIVIQHMQTEKTSSIQLRSQLRIENAAGSNSYVDRIKSPTPEEFMQPKEVISQAHQQGDFKWCSKLMSNIQRMPATTGKQ